MISPVIPYAVLWTLLLFLFSLRITTIINEPLYPATIILVGCNILGLIISYCLIGSLGVYKSKTKKNDWSYQIPVKLLKKINKLFDIIVIVGNLLNGIYRGGWPLLWLIIGDEKNYADYGIPTYTGLLNALYAISVVSFLVSNLHQKKSLLTYRSLFYIFYPILVGNRGLFIFLAIQSFVVFSTIKRASFKKTILGWIAIIVVIIGFGVLGDFRINDFDHKIKSGIVRSEYQKYVSSLTSGFLWVYLYSTGPINNLNSHINYVDPSYVPFYSLTGFLPSIVRDLFQPKGVYPFPLVSPLINTFTAYANYLNDFGLELTILIFFVYHLFLINFYFKLKRGDIFAIFGYSSLFSAHMLSFFWDFYTIWYTIFQIIFSYYFINHHVYKKILSFK